MAGNESLRTGLPVKIADLNLGVDLSRRAVPEPPGIEPMNPADDYAVRFTDITGRRSHSDRRLRQDL